MHSVYLVAKEFRGCFKGKFWCSVLLLFYLEAIYLPVLKSLVHIYVMSQINCLRLTQILYPFYILELIRLAIEGLRLGLTIVDPTKTIAASYSQGNVEVFGKATASTQCVAMSLSALVYNFRSPITSSADLVQIMNIENNMYSAMSQSCKQGLLLLADLPVMDSYQLTYSESYSGLLNSALPITAEFLYVVPLLAAFNSLLMDN